MSSDRVVVLRPDDPASFLADACAAAAEAVNEVRVWQQGDANLVELYGELVFAYARLRRADIARSDHATVRLAVIDHLVERLAQARNGEITTRALEIADRLHGELTAEPAPA